MFKRGWCRRRHLHDGTRERNSRVDMPAHRRDCVSFARYNFFGFEIYTTRMGYTFDRGKAIMLELGRKKGKGKYEFCFGGLLAGGIVPAV